MARRLQLIACVAAALSAFLAVIGLGDVPADVNVLGTVHRWPWLRLLSEACLPI
jgi:hypothetical protein